MVINDSMIINDAKGLGRIRVDTVPLPAFATGVSATYTYAGAVLVFYHRDGAPRHDLTWRTSEVSR